MRPLTTTASLLSLLLYASTALGQVKPVSFDYAIIYVNPYSFFYTAEYSDGRIENLDSILHLKVVPVLHLPGVAKNQDDLGKYLFQCFNYLNSKGYELVTGFEVPNGVGSKFSSPNFVFKKQR